MKATSIFLLLMVFAITVGIGQTYELSNEQKLTGVTVLAFGPENVLFIGNSKEAKIHAVETEATEKSDPIPYNLEGFDQMISEKLGITPREVIVTDMNTPPGKTKDGFETQMGINVIGHFLLAKILVEITKRQVWLSSKGHIRFGAPRIDLEAITNVDESTYIPRARYQQAKLGDILLAKQFAEQYPHLMAVSVHPGGVKTDLGRHMTTGQKIKFILTNPLIVMSMRYP